MMLYIKRDAQCKHEDVDPKTTEQYQRYLLKEQMTAVKLQKSYG